MKKFGFYAAALAFCVLLVGVVAVSSPIEADAMDTLGHSNAHIRTGSVPIDLIKGETVEHQFWSVNPSTGDITGSDTVPASGGYIKAEVDGGKITLTLNNVKVNPGVPFALDMGNANVELRLVGDNILNSTDYWPAIYVTSEDEYKSESNLTITGSGSLTCYGNGNSGGAAVYAEYNLTVTGGAELYAYAEDPDAAAAGSGNGGTARTGDTTSKHGLFAGGSLTVESGSVVEGVGGKLTDFASESVDCSDGVHVNGGITVESGGSLRGTGSEVNGTDGNMFIRGIYAGGSITVEEGAAATGLGGNITSAANGYLESYGFYAEGGAIDVDGTLNGTGGDVTSTGVGSPSSCGVGTELYTNDGVPCSFSGIVTAKGGEIIEGSGNSYGLNIQSRGLDLEAGAVVSATGGDAANGSSYGASVDKDVSVAGQFTASAGDAESLNGSYSCGLYVMFSNSSVTVAPTGRLIASGGSAGCTGGMGSTSAGLWAATNSVTIAGYAELTGGNASVTDGEDGSNPATADSYGLFASDVAVTGELVAKSGEAVYTTTGSYGAAAYSAGIWTGDMSIAERAEVEATSGKAQSDGSETISAGVYLDPANSDGITEGIIRPDNPGGSGSSGNGGEEKVCSLTVDGSLSATGGEASGEEASSAGIFFRYTGMDKTAAGFTVGKTGVVTANGGSVGDSSAGVYYDGPATINGKLTAEGGEAYFSAGLSIETISVKGVLTAAAGNGETISKASGVYSTSMSVEEGAHVIADVTGAEADEKTALLLYAEDTSSLTLPSEYRWRTSADGEFTLYSVEPYVYEFDGTNLSGSDIYVEIAPVEVPATGVTLSESGLVLDEGETAQLTASVVPEGTTDELVWSSSNPDVATVDENGLVTAVGPGRTVISATAGSVSAVCSVTVRGGSVDVGPTYEIELDEGIVGGEIKTSLTNASAGSTIRVTATPDAGYELAYITVDGERIPGTSFTMPAHDVTVSAVFTRGEGFADVAPGSWYYDAVEFVRARGLMDGVSETEFNPDDTMTRAMVWAILGRLDGEEISGSGWLEAARAWALESGVSDGTEPNAAVTREQLVTMLYCFADEPATAADLNGYSDGGEVSDWASDAFAWAIEHIIITGVDDDTLAPKSTATRAQCAAILMRFTQL